MERVNTVARKLNIPLDGTDWIGESLWSITKDGGKERDFIRHWGIIANYLELHGIHDGDGVLMGLAARKVGWNINNTAWATLKGCVKHLDVSDRRGKVAFWQGLRKRIGYHYRLNKARIAALRDFKLYYR